MPFTQAFIFTAPKCENSYSTSLDKRKIQWYNGLYQDTLIGRKQQKVIQRPASCTVKRFWNNPETNSVQATSSVIFTLFWSYFTRVSHSSKCCLIVKDVSKSRDEINHIDRAALPALGSEWPKTWHLRELSNRHERRWPLSREMGGQVCMAEWRRSTGYPSALEGGERDGETGG